MLAAPGAAALRIPPPPDHRINDYAGALSPADRDRLEQTADRARGARAATRWWWPSSARSRARASRTTRSASPRRGASGQKGLDNGVIFLVFVDDRKMRIEVGYGLEGSLTDAISSSILRDVVAPRFREGQIADGIAAGLDAIDQAIAGTYQRPPGAGAGQPARLASRAARCWSSCSADSSTFVQTRAASARARGARAGRAARRGGAGPSSAAAGGWSAAAAVEAAAAAAGFSGGGGSFGGGGSSGSW